MIFELKNKIYKVIGLYSSVTLLAFLLGWSGVSSGQSSTVKKNAKSKVTKVKKLTTKTKKELTPEEKDRLATIKVNQLFVTLAKKYLANRISKKSLWVNLEKLFRTGRLQRLSKVHGLQMQAEILRSYGLPVLGATYAADALKLADNPLATRYSRAWHILQEVSREHPIQFILEDLAANIPLKGGVPSHFGSDWYYFSANAYSLAGKDDTALSLYSRLTMSSRYFMPARYQIGMIKYEKKDIKGALASLKSILYNSTRGASPLSEKDKIEMANYANMAIGRIHYEQKQFLASARHYRRVTKTSPVFYDALVEQAWSLFMSGNPKHSLGTLYSANSSFFSDVSNPELKVLESIVYFWMCRYRDARNSLADFAEDYAKTISSLSAITQSQRLTPVDAFDLFENMIAGVSSKSLGLPRDVLKTAATRDTMLLIRDQLATVMSEHSRLKYKGLNGLKKYIANPRARIISLQRSLQTQLGKQFITEIEAERDHYQELYSQAEFLYLELLMSEKEQMLGRELHAKMKVSKVSDYEDIRGWGRDTQSWKGERKGEYWWDEIGFHLVDVEPKCVEDR